MHARRCVIVLVCVAWAAQAGTASAQEDPARVGLTTGYPASVGVLVRAGDRIALRPSLTFATTTSSGPYDDTNDTSSIGATLNVNIYATRHDNLRTYVSPSLGFNHLSASSSSSSTTKGNGYTVGGFLGAEYTLHRRFGLFAELGARYAHSSTKATFTPLAGTLGLPPDVTVIAPIPSGISTTSHGFGTASAIGAILGF